MAYPALVDLSITGGFTLGGTSDYPQRREDWVCQLIDNITWTRFDTRTGDRATKAGVQLKFFEFDGFFDSNFRGTYTFPTLAAFVAGTPTRFTQNQGNTNLARPNQIYGFYVQDDWRPTPNLTLNLGLRYDYEGAKTEALRDVIGAAGNGISRDRNNVAPRFGFAWAPRGGTRDVVYGGTGVYYDQVILNIVGNARFTPPKVIGVQIDNPRSPDPLAGGTVSIPAPNLSVIDENLHTPWNWNTQLDDNPKYFNTDVTLQWTPRLSGNRTLKITAEAFNAFNLPQRNLPTESISSGTFGQITSVRQPRAIQFTAQFGF